MKNDQAVILFNPGDMPHFQAFQALARMGYDPKDYTYVVSRDVQEGRYLHFFRHKRTRRERTIEI